MFNKVLIRRVIYLDLIKYKLISEERWILSLDEVQREKKKTALARVAPALGALIAVVAGGTTQVAWCMFG